MARTPGPPEDRKHQLLKVSMTHAEYERLKLIADMKGLPPATWARVVVMEAMNAADADVAS